MGLKAASWIFFQNSQTYDSLNTTLVQIMTLVVFLIFFWSCFSWINPLKSLATLAGFSMFIMSILFIVLMIAALAINPNGGYQTMDWIFKNLIPSFKLEYFTSLSMVIYCLYWITQGVG